MGERTRAALVSESLTADMLEKIGLSVDTDKPPFIDLVLLHVRIRLVEHRVRDVRYPLDLEDSTALCMFDFLRRGLKAYLQLLDDKTKAVASRFTNTGKVEICALFELSQHRLPPNEPVEKPRRANDVLGWWSEKTMAVRIDRRGEWLGSSANPHRVP
jgi:hypothetical protein